MKKTALKDQEKKNLHKICFLFYLFFFETFFVLTRQTLEGDNIIGSNIYLSQMSALFSYLYHHPMHKKPKNFY